LSHQFPAATEVDVVVGADDVVIVVTVLVVVDTDVEVVVVFDVDVVVEEVQDASNIEATSKKIKLSQINLFFISSPFFIICSNHRRVELISENFCSSQS
jgi:hypothetical protein